MLELRAELVGRLSKIHAALAAQLGGGLVLSRIVFLLRVTLPGRDLHHADSVADYVGGALLALRPLRHRSGAPRAFR